MTDEQVTKFAENYVWLLFPDLKAQSALNKIPEDKQRLFMETVLADLQERVKTNNGWHKDEKKSVDNNIS